MSITRRRLVGAAIAAPIAVKLGPAFAAGPAPTSQVSGVRHIKVPGGVVTALLDGSLPIGAEAFSNLSAEEASGLLERAFMESGPVATGVNCYLFRDGDRTILIDAGGAGAFPNMGELSAALGRADVAPEDIDMVLLTHLHPDHVGGMVTDGAPAFPNAEVVAHDTDISFWTSEDNRAGAPDSMKGFFDLASGVVEAYGDRLTAITGEVEVTTGISSVLLPGHTPGHTGYMIGQGDDALLVWGDIIHVGAFQFPKPEAAIGFDVNPEQAIETRKMILERADAEHLRVAGMHIGFPGVGRVVRHDEGYVFDPEPWTFDLG